MMMPTWWQINSAKLTQLTQRLAFDPVSLEDPNFAEWLRVIEGRTCSLQDNFITFHRENSRHYQLDSFQIQYQSERSNGSMSTQIDPSGMTRYTEEQRRQWKVPTTYNKYRRHYQQKTHLICLSYVWCVCWCMCATTAAIFSGSSE